MSGLLRPYGEGDLDLQLRLLGDAATMAHLGGAETREQIERRHERYRRMTDPEAGRMFVIATDGVAAGTIGYWGREWLATPIWESGWFVLPEFRGRRLASAALIEVRAAIGRLDAVRPLHAFPSVENAPSNAVCARAGLALVGPVDFEYPPGRALRCNDWVADTG